MAEGGLPGPAPCSEEQQPTLQPQLVQQIQMCMNWSHFKPVFWQTRRGC